MITTTQMKQALHTLPKNQWIKLSEIQNFIQSHFQLDSEDWNSTYETNYPEWKHRLQAVLHEYKEKFLVEHEPGIAAKDATNGIAKEPKYKFK